MNRPKKPKILLTGFTGQVGSEIAATLPANFDLILARRQNEEFIDLTDFAATRDFIRTTKPDIIINPAAYTSVDKAESEPQLALMINGEVPRILAEEAKAIGAILIHYSTDYVFNGDPAHLPWRETDTPDPLSEYGKTKLAGERAIAASGCRHLIFRTSWVFGVRGHNFVKTILLLAGEQDVLTVVNDQVGAPTSAGFLAQMTWAAVERLVNCDGDKNELQGLFHLTCSGACSWHELASEIIRIERKKNHNLKVQEIVGVSTTEYKMPATRPLNSRLDCSRFDASFGKSRIHWQSALEAVLRRLD